MATGICLSAQVPEKEILQTPTDTAAVTVAVPEGYMLADSIVVRPADPVDSTLAGLNIFSVMPSKEKGGNADVKVHQSQYIRDAILQHIGINGTRTMDGYRVRIFFDNRQTARTESEAALLRFSEGHPGISAYRSYANPYFKVTVGDFRIQVRGNADAYVHPRGIPYCLHREGKDKLPCSRQAESGRNGYNPDPETRRDHIPLKVRNHVETRIGT